MSAEHKPTFKVAVVIAGEYSSVIVHVEDAPAIRLAMQAPELFSV